MSHGTFEEISKKFPRELQESYGSSMARYVNVSLTPQAYQLLKQLKEELGLRSYSDVIFYLHKGYKDNCAPKFNHEEVTYICKLLDENWDSIGEFVARLLGTGKRARG